VFNRATDVLVKAGLGYLDALREYRASGGQHMDKHELYEANAQIYRGNVRRVVWLCTGVGDE
jgi:hypothetical protein